MTTPAEMPSTPRQWPDPDWLEWPAATSEDEAKTVFAAKVEARKLRIQAAINRARDEHAADLAQNAMVQTAFVESAKSGLDRARANVEQLQKAAAVVATIYSSVLAATYSISKPVPARGLLPAFFLGLSLVLATAYLSYLGRHARSDQVSFDRTSDPTGVSGQVMRVNVLSKAVGNAVRRRIYLMRAGVLAFAVGVMTLPIGFISFSDSTTASLATAIPWPSPRSTPTDTELEKIRYQAEVAEVARLRQAANNDTSGDVAAVTFIGAVGLLMIFGGAAIGRSRKTKKDPEQAVTSESGGHPM